MDADANATGGEGGGEVGSTVLALDRGSQVPPMLFFHAWRYHHKRIAANERMARTPRPAERPAIKGMSVVLFKVWSVCFACPGDKLVAEAVVDAKAETEMGLDAEMDEAEDTEMLRLRGVLDDGSELGTTPPGPQPTSAEPTERISCEDIPHWLLLCMDQ